MTKSGIACLYDVRYATIDQSSFNMKALSDSDLHARGKLRPGQTSSWLRLFTLPRMPGLHSVRWLRLSTLLYSRLKLKCCLFSELAPHSLQMIDCSYDFPRSNFESGCMLHWIGFLVPAQAGIICPCDF